MLSTLTTAWARARGTPWASAAASTMVPRLDPKAGMAVPITAATATALMRRFMFCLLLGRYGFTLEALGLISATHVLFVRHHLQVIRVDASARPAAVIELLARGDRTMFEHVHYDVNGHGAAIERHACVVLPPSLASRRWSRPQVARGVERPFDDLDARHHLLANLLPARAHSNRP
ncbi:hypothetical protein BRAO375_3660036 [Bradyrhizobium sp. ORS 375]|nr:hypothetical protein BRAO375_3660036 [Bradyrhizobium sp. ORS 375]